VVYVGSNAGMLHAINGATSGVGAGQELWAYVPTAVYQGPTATPAVNGLAARGDPDFTHKFFVDGTPLVADIDFGRTPGGSGTDWRTILIGSLGKGGKSYFAIDVTDPASMTTEATVAAKVLWEFSHADLGYTYGEPAVVKTKKYGWVLIFGSGYNNTDGRPYFFIVNPRTGALLERIEAKEASGATVGGPANQAGLAQVQAFVLDRTDYTADSAYAGDLLGNLWRLDLRPLSGSYATPTKIAELTDAAGARVPVTSRPLVVIQPVTGKRFITVGSGRFLDSTDVGSTQSQTFYGVIDGTSAVFSTASTLPTGFSFPIQQSNLKKLTDLTIKNLLNPATQIGWWYDLGVGAGSLGWRVISDPTAFYGVVAFTAMLPNGDVCNASGRSRVFAIDVGTGQSAIISGTNTLAYNDNINGVVTDLRWLSVNRPNGTGTLRLMAGSDRGEIRPIEIRQLTGAGMRRLNWRELPLAD
jgi:type IV pilus assembly protein PilY1